MGDEETYELMGGGFGLMLGSEPITISDSNPLFSISEDDLQRVEKPHFPKKLTLEATATVNADHTSVAALMESIGCDKVQVNMIPDHRHLPRRMKKAVGATYRRDTKWKRKAALWLQRNTVAFTGRISHDKDGVTFSGVSE